MSQEREPDAPWERLLHLHAQAVWHDDAFVIGNRWGLLALREAIDRALSEGAATCDQFTTDGEGYDLFVVRDDDAEAWVHAAVPYTLSDIAGERREGAVWPHDRATVREQRATS